MSYLQKNTAETTNQCNNLRTNIKIMIQSKYLQFLMWHFPKYFYQYFGFNFIIATSFL